MDALLERTENPKEFLRTIVDPLNQKKIVLTDAQLRMVRSIVRGDPIGKGIKHPWEQERDKTQDKTGVMFWNVPKPIGSLHKAPEPKRRFMASKHERKIINKIVNAIKLGRIDLNAKRKQEQEDQKKIDKEFCEEEFIEGLGILQDIWTQDPPKLSKLDPLIAPGFDLPDHVDSFNPAPEFLEDSRQCKYLYKSNFRQSKKKFKIIRKCR